MAESVVTALFYGATDGYCHHNGTISSVPNKQDAPVVYKDQPFWSQKVGRMLTYPAWVCPVCGDQW